MNKFLSRIIRSNPIGQLFNLGGKTAAWKKVRELKAGMKIAIADPCHSRPDRESIKTDPRFREDDIAWDEIVSIKKLPPERVWDIEVEGTHNFIGGHYVDRRTGAALTAKQEELVAEYKKATSFEVALSGAVDSRPTDTVTRLTENKSVVNSGGEPENPRLQSPSAIADGGQGTLSSLTAGRTGYRSGSATMPIDSPPSTILAELKAQGIDPDDIRFGGIVAHNTSGILLRAGSASLQLSSSATSTTADIELAAADQIDLFAGRFSLTTSSATAGDVKIDSAGTFTLSTSRNNANILLLPGSGNIGIGTTTPNDKLTVAGTAFLGGTSTGLNINAGTITSAYAPGQAGDNEIPIVINAIGASTTSLTLQTGGSDRIKIDANGNVGIGTSVPLGILDAKGDASILLRAGTASLSLSGGTTSTTADLQLAAADKISLFGSSFSLTTSSGSAGDLKLDSAGTLTISTSRNNTNIALMPGTGGVALGISTPNSSATLDLSSTTKGLLPPRMTTTQRDNISSPTKGLVIFNDSTNQLNYYNGSAWGAVDHDSGCNSSNDCTVVLTPEYGNAIISADGSNNIGTVTSDLTISASNYYYNYYEFSSGQASLQDYDVYVSWQLPSGWADWDDAANAISIDLATEDASSANTKVDATIYRQGDADSYSETANVSPTAGEWRTTLEGKSVLDITKTNLNTIATWAAGDVMVIKLKLYSKDNYYSRVGNIRIIYENQ